MSKEDMRKAPASVLKLSEVRKRKAAGRIANLKSSSWYEGALRSIAISKGKQPERSGEWIK